MYYILNETHQVIAADDSFLTYCAVSHINELYVKIAKGEIELNIGLDENLTLALNNKEEVLSVDKVILSSLLGKLTLISISSELEEEVMTSVTTPIEDESNELIDSIIDERDDTEEEITFGDHLDLENILDDETISSTEEMDINTKEDEKENTLQSMDLPNDNELFDFVSDDETNSVKTNSSNLDNLDIDFDMVDTNHIAINLDDQNEEVSEILIDSEAISQKIGISNDDYKNFLNDFIDTALGLEKDLQSSDLNTRDDAINTLSHLSDVLHLPVITKIISSIKENGIQIEDIESLYSTLSRITTQETKIEQEISIHEPLEIFSEPSPTVIEENLPPKETQKGESFGTISLENIKPKHFDFQLEEAANDLSLPVELIEEFVHDFIEQSHIETKKMLHAYEDGDLDTIQKIGHLLKGASSNLRINPLSNTLYKIQFCEKSSDLETLIKDYWAHFISFETQINTISN